MLLTAFWAVTISYSSDIAVINKTDCAAASSRPIDLHAKNGYTVEILLYSFSSGDEIYSRGDDEKISTEITSGELKSLIKIRRNGALVKAVFIQSKGGDCSEAFRSLILKIQSELAAYTE